MWVVIGGSKSWPGWVRSTYHPTLCGDTRAYHATLSISMRGLPDDVAASAKNVADRSVANTMEQAIAFLVLLWLHAIFVNPRIATILGWIYVTCSDIYKRSLRLAVVKFVKYSSGKR